MRTAELGRTAAQAEFLRIKRLVRRQAMRAVWAAVASVFVIAMLVMIHVIAYFALVPATLSPLLGAVALFGFDLVVTVIFGIMAMRSAPDVIEVEAKLIRDRSLHEMKQSLAIGAIISAVTRLAFRSSGRKSGLSVTLSDLISRFVSSKSR